jgi:hypothetical protein
MLTRAKAICDEVVLEAGGEGVGKKEEPPATNE